MSVEGGVTWGWGFWGEEDSFGWELRERRGTLWVECVEFSLCSRF